MLDLCNYDFEGSEIRVVRHSDEPWFVLPDACRILGLSNPTMVAQPLDETERSKFFLGRQGETTIVSQGGLLTIVLRCREALTPGTVAYRFRKWVTAELLPSLMRDGFYVMPGRGSPAISGMARIALARETLARRHLPKTIDRLEQAKHPVTRRIDLALAQQDCATLGIAPPSDDDFPLAQGNLFGEGGGA